jgi:hypothetical protein
LKGRARETEVGGAHTAREIRRGGRERTYRRDRTPMNRFPYQEQPQHVDSAVLSFSVQVSDPRVGDEEAEEDGRGDLPAIENGSSVREKWESRRKVGGKEEKRKKTHDRTK